MRFFDILRSKKRKLARANAIYLAAVQQSRHPLFYTDYGVPDTVDGRFDMIVAHVMLIIRRLRGEGGEAADMSQLVLNLMFDDMDRNFREMGIGDMSIGKHVKKTAKAFYGRADIIETGLESGQDELCNALLETVFRSTRHAEDSGKKLASYLINVDAYLKGQAGEFLLQGDVSFTPRVSAQ